MRSATLDIYAAGRVPEAFPASMVRPAKDAVMTTVQAVERAGLSSLNEGAKVSYEEKENRGKMSAENLRVG